MLIQPFSVLAFQGATEWIKYDSPEGRYSLSVPAQPKLTTQESAAASGEKFPQYLANVYDGNNLFLIAYFDLPPETTYSLDKARDGMLSAVKATLISEGSISLDGTTGRELKASVAGPDGVDYLVYARIYNVERRVYILQFIVAKSADDSVAAARSAKYFNSFKVTKGS
jgi:hypothetical protein